ncbi:MAG: hypothetical protein Q8942_13300 [Bacillota bacterium]|nr:hypothetical protein [Bacillota bacterium]
MNNRVLTGKVEFIVIAIINMSLISLTVPLISIIAPIIYFLAFWALYRGHSAVKGFITVLNLLTAFLFGSLPIYNEPLYGSIINLVIPIMLIILTIFIFVGRSRSFIKYKSLICQKRLAKIFDNEDY